MQHLLEPAVLVVFQIHLSVKCVAAKIAVQFLLGHGIQWFAIWPPRPLQMLNVQTVVPLGLILILQYSRCINIDWYFVGKFAAF